MCMNLSLMFSIWLQDRLGAFKRIWSWIDHSFTIGNFSISLVSLALGVLTMVAALIVARTACSLIQRRLERRKNLDPGLQYTLLRDRKSVV